MNHYRHIAIEGNIGAGKTTLATLLAERLGARFLPENFGDNPFLAPFYEDPARHAFPVELSFLEDRFHQVKEAAKKEGALVSDYLWEKSLVFARINLSGEELRLFERIFSVLGAQLSPPDLVLYLHRLPDKLIRQIGLRGREFEKNIQPDYLGKVGAGYRDFFTRENRMPVIWLDNDLGPEALAQAAMKLLGKRYAPGLHVNP